MTTPTTRPSPDRSHQLDWFDFLGRIGAATMHFGGLKGTQQLFKLLQLKPDDTLSILEVGCGTGYTSCLIGQQFKSKVTGIDLSKDMILTAKRRASKLGLRNVEFQVASALDLPFASGTFDVVFAEAVTALLPDKRRALDEYVHVTKPGGQVADLELFVTPEAPPGVVNDLNQIAGSTIGGEVTVPTDGEWRALVESTGLVDIRVIEDREAVMYSRSPRQMVKTYGFLGSIGLVLRMVYYFVADWKLRRMMVEASKLLREAFAKKGREYRYVGYLVFRGRKA